MSLGSAFLAGAFCFLRKTGPEKSHVSRVGVPSRGFCFLRKTCPEKNYVSGVGYIRIGSMRFLSCRSVRVGSGARTNGPPPYDLWKCCPFAERAVWNRPILLIGQPRLRQDDGHHGELVHSSSDICDSSGSAMLTTCAIQVFTRPAGVGTSQIWHPPTYWIWP